MSNIIWININQYYIYITKKYITYILGRLFEKFISIENDRINFIGKSIVPDKKNIMIYLFYGKVNFNDNDYFIDLVYIFLYPINKGYKIAFWNDIGYHTGDIEHIIIRINKYTEKIIKVFFSAHSKEHTIHYLKDLSLCNYCKTLKVYVAFTFSC